MTGEHGDRAQHDLEAGAAGRARAGPEVLGEGVRGEHEPQHVLGPLGVATGPVHVLEDAWHRARRGPGVGHRQHVGQALVGLVRVLLEHPQVLAAALALVLDDADQAADEGPVRRAVAQRERAQRQRPRLRLAAAVAGLAPGRRLGEGKQVLADVAVRLGEQPGDHLVAARGRPGRHSGRRSRGPGARRRGRGCARAPPGRRPTRSGPRPAAAARRAAPRTAAASAAAGRGSPGHRRRAR